MWGLEINFSIFTNAVIGNAGILSQFYLLHVSRWLQQS